MQKLVSSQRSRLHPSDASVDEAKPTEANTVAEIKAYLDAHGIAYTSDMLKADLLALVV